MGWQADAGVLQYIRRRVDEFKEHLQATYPADPRTEALVAKLLDVRLLEPKTKSGVSYNSGVFSHTTGTLGVAPRDGRGVVRSESNLNKTIVHELAHATRFKHPGESSHSKEWKSSFVWFLGVATEELGWTVDLPCSVETFYGLGRKDCPMCEWSNQACGRFTGPPK